MSKIANEERNKHICKLIGYAISIIGLIWLVIAVNRLLGISYLFQYLSVGMMIQLVLQEVLIPLIVIMSGWSIAVSGYKLLVLKNK